MSVIIFIVAILAFLRLFFLFLRSIFTLTFTSLKNVVNDARKIPKSEQYMAVKDEQLYVKVVREFIKV